MRLWPLALLVLVAGCGQTAQVDVDWKGGPAADGSRFIDYVYQGVSAGDTVERLSSRGVTLRLSPGDHTIESFRCGDMECDERLDHSTCRKRVHVVEGGTHITVTVRPDAPCTIG